MRRRGPAWVFPDRKRCMTCRRYFGFTVIDGLYDSWGCAGRTDPDLAPPEDWPREHYVPQAGGGRKPKRAFLEERKARRAATRNRKEAYRCGYCGQWHIGSLWSSDTLKPVPGAAGPTSVQNGT